MADSRLWYPQEAFRARKGKGGGRAAGYRQPDTTWESLGHSTSKIPPYWEPKLEQNGYPFRIWLQDVSL